LINGFGILTTTLPEYAAAQEEEILKTRKRWMVLKNAKMIIKLLVLEIYIAFTSKMKV